MNINYYKKTIHLIILIDQYVSINTFFLNQKIYRMYLTTDLNVI